MTDGHILLYTMLKHYSVFISTHGVGRSYILKGKINNTNNILLGVGKNSQWVGVLAASHDDLRTVSRRLPGRREAACKSCLSGWKCSLLRWCHRMAWLVAALVSPGHCRDTLKPSLHMLPVLKQCPAPLLHSSRDTPPLTGLICFSFPSQLVSSGLMHILF